MPGEKPFFIEGVVVDIMSTYEIAFVKVINGNVYNLKPSTPGVDFYTLKIGQIVELEVTTKLVRVLSARIIDTDKDNAG